MATVVTARLARPSAVGISIAAAGISLALATVGLMVADRALVPDSTLAGLPPQWVMIVRDTVQTIGLCTLSVIAGLVVWRQPHNLFSRAFIAALLFIGVWMFAAEYAVYGLVIDPGKLPLADLAAWTQGVVAPNLLGISALLVVLLFPDGALKSPRWRLLVVALVLVLAWAIVSALDNPYQISVGLFLNRSVPVTIPPVLWPLGARLSWASVALLPALILVALAVGLSVFLRMRAAAGEARQQLKWFTYAAVVFVITGLMGRASQVASLDWLPGLSQPLDSFASSDVAGTITGWGGLSTTFAGMVLLPLAIGVAMVRYRLYDIDIVINRTIIYGGLALFVTGGYAIIVGGVGGLLGQRAGLNPVLSVLTIALLAILLLPVRSRLQDLADLAVYGKRARPYDVLSDFTESIGHAESAQVLLPRMAELLRQGTGATGTEVWARVGDGLQLAAASPPIDAPAAVADAEQIGARHAGAASVEPVFHDGHMLGALVVVKPRGEDLSVVERRLFRDVASQAGLVLTRFRLVQELRESRARIVASQDIERHRIERNLHDGAQQRFVNALLSLGMAQAEGEHDSGGSDFLREASREVQAGLNELRSLARGLQPPLLGESGIVAASTALADAAPIATTVIAPIPDRRYSQGIETAAYFVISESLTNAAKHSHAKQVTVTINEVAGRLSIEVRDDGVGGAEISDGSGIIGLQDRVAAVGGRLTVESPKGGGTIVRAELPCT